MNRGTETYRVLLAYDGRAFAGFARQPGQHTVEAVLRAVLRQVAPDFKAFAVAGRTDRGVSAVGQVVSFRSGTPNLVSHLHRAIDEVDPGKLACLEVQVVPRWFHAQHSAVSRTYVYFTDSFDPALDVARLDRLLGALIGTRCFSAFARDTPPGASTIRRLMDAQARTTTLDTRKGVRFEFTANAFLRRQVRIMVSTGLREAMADAPDDRLVELAETGDRRLTAPAADPFGLTLVHVGYPGSLPDPHNPNGAGQP